MKLATLMLTAIAGFAAMTGTAGSATFLYVGSSDSQDITVMALDQKTGALSPVAVTPVPGPAKPGGSLPLAVSPDKKFMYAALRNEPFTVVSFAIDPKTGKLNQLGSNALAGSMAYIVTDRTGRYLLSASYPGHLVSVNPIQKGVAMAPAQTVPTEQNAHAILTDASNKHALHTSLGGSLLYVSKFDPASGKLTLNDPPGARVKDKAGSRHMVFSPNGKFVYLLNELDATIDVFGYDGAKGKLTPLQNISAMPQGSGAKPWAADIHITPDGRFVYASERTTSTLSAYKVDPGKGTLTLIETVPTEKQPRGFAIDPTGKFLYAAGQLSNSLTAYAIDKSSGKLTRLKDYPVGKNPNWIEIVAFR